MDDLTLKKAQKGDASAFSALVSEHEGRAYSLALRLMGNREDALDATQEAWIKMYKNIKSFRGESSFSTWVYRIVYNTCLDQLRRRKNVISLEGVQEKNEGFRLASDTETPEAAYTHTEIRDAIRKGLDTLVPEHKQIIVLRDIQGFSYEEIAEILGTEIGTVKSRLFRARKNLEKYLLNNFGTLLN